MMKKKKTNKKITCDKILYGVFYPVTIILIPPKSTTVANTNTSCRVSRGMLLLFHEMFHFDDEIND